MNNSDNEIAEHLLIAFIKRHVEPSQQDRWRHSLIGSRPGLYSSNNSERQRKALYRASQLLDAFAPGAPIAKRINEKIGNYDLLPAEVKDVIGLVYSPGMKPFRATAIEALDWYSRADESGILLFPESRFALFFRHGGGVYLCQ